MKSPAVLLALACLRPLLVQAETTAMMIASPDFQEGGMIPARLPAMGANVNPRSDTSGVAVHLDAAFGSLAVFSVAVFSCPERNPGRILLADFWQEKRPSPTLQNISKHSGPSRSSPIFSHSTH